MEHTHTDCRQKSGIVVSLIDAIIAQCRVIRSMDLSDSAVVEAIKDLRNDEDLNFIMNNSIPATPANPKTAAPVKTMADVLTKHLNSQPSFPNERMFPIHAVTDMMTEYADHFRQPVKLVTDEEIHRSITAMHPDIIGNTPLQMLMREKIRISLEWMRKQLTGE